MKQPIPGLFVLVIAIMQLSFTGNNLAMAQQGASRSFVLLVGVPYIDHSKYIVDFSDAATSGVLNDLGNIQDMLERCGIPSSSIHTLKGKASTAENILKELQLFITQMKRGDKLYFYYSGHGYQVPDQNGDEPDGADECLVTYNKYLIDDALYEAWIKVPDGARIIMLVDACHSGSIFKMADYRVNKKTKDTKMRFRVELAADYKLEKNGDPVDFNILQNEPFQMIYIGATTDAGSAIGHPDGSEFTAALVNLFRKKYPLEWQRYTYRDLPDLLNMENITYLEIGKLPETFKEEYPFKP